MRELARRAGVSHSLISEVVNGNANPSADFSVAIARAINERPDELLRMAGFLDDLPPAVADEHELVTLYRQLPTHLRQAALAALRGVVGAGVPRPALTSVPPATTDIENLTTEHERFDVLFREIDFLEDWQLRALAVFLERLRGLQHWINGGNNGESPHDAVPEPHQPRKQAPARE